METESKIEKGTIRVNSWEELNSIAEQLDWQVVSPGGAASMLDVSRAYIHQLEKDKRIRAYRLDGAFDKKGLPRIIQMIITPPVSRDYIYIPIVDLEEYKKEIGEKKKKKKKK